MWLRWVIAGLLGVVFGGCAAANASIELLSRIEGTPALSNLPNKAPAVGGLHSADGRFVAFTSAATNLVAGVPITFNNVFLYDRETGTTELLTSGANGFSSSASISGDGSAVLFRSFASNLVEGDNNQNFDIFVYDRETGVTELISVGAQAGVFSSAISGDGRFVTYSSASPDIVSGDTNGTATDVFLYDRQTGTTTLVTAGADQRSTSPAISWDGQFVAFHSRAGNLVAGDTNDADDIFVYDRINNSIELLTDGADFNSRFASISWDGRFVAFQSSATNLSAEDTNGPRVDVFVYDRDTDSTQLLTAGGSRESVSPEISGDGRFVVFSSAASNLVPGDTDDDFLEDVFNFDRDTGTIERITAGANGDSRSPLIDGGGRFITLFTEANNLVPGDFQNGAGIVVYDRTAGSFDFLPSQALTFEIAGGDGPSAAPSVSGDGRFIAFESTANNLLAVDSNTHSDIFVYDRNTASNQQLTIGADMGSSAPSISDTGRFVAFQSDATNLVVGDANGQTDIYVFDRETSNIELLTAGGDGNSTSPAISADGRFVAFESRATNLTPDNTFNTQEGIYLYDRELNSTQFVTVGGGGASIDPSISSDGRFVAFSSTGTFPTGVFSSVNVLDIYVFDRITGTIEALTAGVFGQSFAPSISADGQLVAFNSGAGNLGVGDNGASTVNEIFVHDRATSVTRIVTPDPIAPNFSAPSISADGRFVAFSSVDFTLVPEEDMNAFEDVFVYELATETTSLVSKGSNGESGTGASFAASISGDGQVIAFTSNSISFANDGTFALTDVFVVASALPIADAQTVTTNEDTPVTITVTGSETTPSAFLIVTQPSNGELTGSAPDFVYTPNPDFFGIDNFTFTVNDGSNSSTAATVSITVNSVNDAPIATGDSDGMSEFTVAEDTSVAITLAGGDVDNDSLLYAVVSEPTSGFLSGTVPNLIYTPNPGFIGTDNFTFTVSDGEETSAPATISITVGDVVVTLFSAVLPASRSVEVGTTATAFGTLINAGTADAQNCAIVRPDTFPADFFFQATDPVTNAVVGDVNQPVDLAAGAAQSFVFGITPSAELPATDVALSFECAGEAVALSVVGLNTLLVSASSTPIPDLIALGATVTGDGVMRLNNNNGFFTTATINVGSAASIVVSADSGGADLPIALSLCQTNPLTSVCINPTVPSVEPVLVDIAAGDTPTFAVFATASETIALDPANNRVFLRFMDELGEVRGATSVAVEN